MSTLKSSRNQSPLSGLYLFTQGIDVDARLAAQEIRVQHAWARSLAELGFLTKSELKTAEDGLAQALLLIRSGDFPWQIEDEDIHMNLERFLTDTIGETGKKLHWGRSRNDLIATTLRLFVADSLAEIQIALKALVATLIARAEKDIDILVPGLTHLQHGQPLRYAHVLSSHAWAFVRDLKRLESASAMALWAMPLGSAALAGTTVAVDLSALATELGFANPPLNSYDAVGDRDFILDALNAFSVLGVHLSRLAEDCIYWSSTAVGLVRLPKDWSTGSSIMPNKRNPDVPELVRAKSAHLIGAAQNALTLMKGLPTSYVSDLHELKSVFLRAYDEATKCLGAFGPFLAGIEVNRGQAEALLQKGHILATEFANDLVSEGATFRDAYKQVAELVEQADKRGESLGQPSRTAGIKVATGDGFEKAVENRKSAGGTSRAQLRAGLDALRKSLE